ncbi:MAG: DUF975 family protein [Bacillota bacterium]|nr:DUF975 family protein [Bacillota bacterium]
MSPESKIRLEARNCLASGRLAPDVISTIVVLLIPCCVIAIIDFLRTVFVLIYNHVNNMANPPSLLAENAIEVSIMAIVITISLIFVSPFFLGYKKYHYALAKGEDANITDIFYYFSKELYVKAVVFNLSLLIRLVTWLFIFLIPALAILLMSPYLYDILNQTENAKYLIRLLVSFFVCIGAIGFVLVTTKYFLAPYLMVETNDPHYAFEASAKIIKDSYYHVLKLMMSFIAWFALCFLVIPILYVMPYYETACAVSAKWIIAMKIDAANNTDNLLIKE